MARSHKSAGPPSRDDFARLMLDALKQAGETDDVRYDAEQFQLRAEGAASRLLNLANVYREYSQAPAAQRPEVLRRYVRSWFAYRKELPATLEDACPDLLPCVRSRSYYELGRLQLEARGMGPADWPYQPLAGDLGVGLVYDLPESIVQLQQHQLTEWRTTFDAALAAARQNLAEVSRQEFESPAPGVWRSPWRDNHDAARLVLTDRLAQYEVRGDLVAMVPNRDTLLLTGADDELGLVNLAEQADEAFEQARPVSGLAVRRSGDEWVPFLPPADHPAHDRLKQLLLKSQGQDYNEQAELLRAVCERRGEDVFVASFFLITHKESGEASSYTVWSADIESLLPHTEKVFFVRVSPDGDGEIVGGGDWDRVRDLAGDLMTPMGLYPERYRVREFPPAERLAALGNPLKKS